MKIFIKLIALFAISFSVFAGNKLSELKDLKPMDKNIFAKPHSSSQSDRLLEGMKLDKYPNVLLADEQTELIAPRVSDGQVSQVASCYLVNDFAYDPYSNAVFTISSSRYYVDGDPDAVELVGRLWLGKIETGKPIIWKDSQITAGGRTAMYDITQKNPPTNTDVFERRYSTISVSNPLKSNDFKDVFITTGCQYYKWPAGSSSGRLEYKMFDLTSVDHIYDQIKPSSWSDIEAWTNAIAGYQFSGFAKAASGIVNGKPIHVYWGTFAHTNTAIKLRSYGLVALDMSKLPAAGNVNDFEDIVDVFEQLPASIMKNFYNDVLMTLDADGREIFNDFSVDFDNSNNLYMAFVQPTGARITSPAYGKDWQKTQVPAVFKTQYKSGELFPGALNVDTMPASVIQNYIESNGGVYDISSENTAYRTQFMLDGQDNIPFAVLGEDEYSILSLLSDAKGAGEIDHLVEFNKHNGQWSIKKVADASIWFHTTANPNNTSQVAYTDQLRWESGWDRYDAGSGSLVNVVPVGNLVAAVGNQGHDIQIAKTIDGQYYVAKWTQIDEQHDIVKLPAKKTFKVVNFGGYQDVFDYTTDTIYKRSIMLSYRHKDSANWSKPVRANGSLLDSFSFSQAYMPRLLANKETVPITFFVAAQQNNVQKNLMDEGRKEMAYNFTNIYAYSYLIIPSAATGPHPVTSIEENTDVNLEAAFPNPTSNIINIPFTITTPSYATLTITNTFGKEVAVVIDGQFLDANNYKVDFNTSGLAIGAYYYTLKAGTQTKTGTFSVVR